MRFLLTMLALLAIGCDRTSSTPQQVVIYSSIDDPYLRPLMQRFEKESGIKVTIVTDTEATKSAAVAERIVAEKDHPQADVYWGNEIFHTINLAEQGVFQPYRPASAADVPAKFRDAGDLYMGVGLRARMIAVSPRPQFADSVKKIHGLADLADPALKGKIAISHPAFGTASGHVAALYVAWGEERFASYMKSLRANEIKLLGGNSAVADQVASGTLAAGLTDSDDVNNAINDGREIEGVLPDQNGEGTLLIPSTVALVKGSPRAEAGRKLIDFICDAKVEKDLMSRSFFVCSVREAGKVKAMEVDYVRCAHEMKKAVELALTILQSR
jgi:iron(III) transport system substrate-binding protein